MKCQGSLAGALVVFALLIGGVAVAQEGTTPAAANLPRISVSEEEFNFGRVTQGVSVSHVFWIRNVGGDILRITDVKPG